MPGSRIARIRRRSGLVAGVAAVGAAGTVALVGVAGAAEQAANKDVYSRDNGLCFSTVASASACATDETAEIDIETGDTVTWHFNGGTDGAPGLPHNAAATDSSWKVPADGSFPSQGEGSHTFTEPGDYEFLCQVHPGTMLGIVHVTGDPIETPTPTPDPPSSPTPTPPAATATPRPTPTPDDHTTTPAPSGGSDNDKPAIRRVKVTGLRRAARVRFWLSEPASVTIRVKRKRTVLRSVRVQAPAGTRTVTVRSKRLKRGRYRVELRARDALGNRSALARKSLRVRR
jgi:plastocyanin